MLSKSCSVYENEQCDDYGRVFDNDVEVKKLAVEVFEIRNIRPQINIDKCSDYNTVKTTSDKEIL